MSRRWTRAITAAALCGAMAGCYARNELKELPPMSVKAGKPVQQPVVEYLEFTGTTRALAKVDLRARVNGYLQEIHFQDGQLVKEGDLLFTIEQAPYEAKLAIAKADVQKAVAQEQLAESELTRYRSLLQHRAATVQEVDVRTAELRGAEASVAAAEAAMRDAELQIGYTEVRAPISGRIGRHLVDQGNLVQAEMTLLATIESIDPIHVYFTIGEDDLLKLTRGGRDSLRRPGAAEETPTLEMGLGDEADRGNYPHEGRLDYADLGVDPDTGTLQYRGVFPNPDGMLVPGLFARVRTPVGDPAPSVLVPEDALGFDQEGAFVLAITPARDEATGERKVFEMVGKDGKTTTIPLFDVERKGVELGTPMGDLRVISEGLAADATIVVSGVQRARPGSQVSVVPEAPPAEEGPGPVADAGTPTDR